MSQILYIDHHSESQAVFEQACSALHIQLIIPSSLEEAQHHIQQDLYEAYILVESQPDVLSLIEEIHRAASQKPIAFICKPKKESATTYRALKEDLQVSYVLEQPVKLEEAEALIKKWAHLEEPIKLSPLAEKIPLNLRQAYNHSISDKLERIGHLVDQLIQNPTQENLAVLKQDVHKIAGSAASYGYLKVSDLCRLWETRLAEQMGPFQAADQSPDHYLYNIQLLRALQLYFQHIYPVYPEHFLIGTSSSSPATPQPDESSYSILSTVPEAIKNIFSPFFKSSSVTPEPTPSTFTEPTLDLYAVTQDKDLIDLLQTVLQDRKVSISIETNALTALRLLSEKSVRPKILMVEQTYPDSPITGKELLSQIEIKKGFAPTSLVLLIEKDLLEDRFNALKEGVNYVLKKPLSHETINYLLSNSIGPTAYPDFKVLVIDDDPDICAFISHALKEINMNVETTSDETRTLDLVNSFHPDLLLLDINMPHYSGWTLLRTLRSDIRYRYLTIVLITAISNLPSIEHSYMESGDEIITKPFNKAALQTRITQIAKRQSILQSLHDRDSVTGYYNNQAFIHLFRKTVWLTAANEEFLSLVLLEIDRFEEIKKILTANQINETLTSISNLLNYSIHEDSLRGYLGEGKFGLTFEGYEASQIETLIHPFLLAAEKNIPIPLTQFPRLTFSCGIAVCKKIDTSIDQMIQGTEDALNKAKITGGNNIRFYHFPLIPSSETTTQEVILVEDDPDVLEILTHAYKSHHFIVTSFTTGKDALQYFNQRKELKGRYLIVLDRNLPDMDGIDILRKIKQKFSYHIRAIFLTSFSSEKDILEGLREGAIDYITKPFSIPILIQKTNLLLNQ